MNGRIGKREEGKKGGSGGKGRKVEEKRKEEVKKVERDNCNDNHFMNSVSGLVISLQSSLFS